MEPLFLEDMAELQGALRLSALKDDSDGQAILEQATRAARVRFYQRLGATKVSDILATDTTDEPETSDEIRRTVANVCEIELVRLQLMDRMPMLFMDASGANRETYNNEGAFRYMDRVTLEAARVRIDSQAQNYLAFLAGEIALGDGDLAQAYTQVKPVPTPILGQTPFIGIDPRVDTLPFTILPGHFDGNFVQDQVDPTTPP